VLPFDDVDGNGGQDLAQLFSQSLTPPQLLLEQVVPEHVLQDPHNAPRDLDPVEWQHRLRHPVQLAREGAHHDVLKLFLPLLHVGIIAAPELE